MNIQEAIEIVNDSRADYEAFRAENDACGYETVSFEEWAGVRNLKAERHDVWAGRFANDTADLY